jgi:predicted negative regulator of RcsB-dependent stress response
MVIKVKLISSLGKVLMKLGKKKEAIESFRLAIAKGHMNKSGIENFIKQLE